MRVPAVIRILAAVTVFGLSAGAASAAHPSHHGAHGSGGGAIGGRGGSRGSGGKTSGSGRDSRGIAGPTSGPLSVNGMWIWYVSKADGGQTSAIIATAQRYHVKTLMIKAGDGTQAWAQFSPQLVAALHAGGLQVCAWQYVYGDHPIAEAKVGAAAVHAGADCLLIDAESEYQGKYVQAQKYIHELRDLVGASFPIGLASFPYVDYHPSFPYSVFLEPGGAQFDVPQMYWPDLGTSVDAVYAHTYSFNEPYDHSIAPLGETAGNPPSRQVARFRRLAQVYGATGVSWWDWQETSRRDWRAVGEALASLDTQPQIALPVLSRHGQGVLGAGDLVVWAQEHLRSAGYPIGIDGVFGSKTQAAVESFQSAQGLPVTGEVDSATWAALLRYPPVQVTWTAKGARVASARSASAAGGLTLPVPRSATLPAVAYEIPPHLGSH